VNRIGRRTVMCMLVSGLAANWHLDATPDAPDNGEVDNLPLQRRRNC
jgi:hypothetical protein